MARTVTVTSIIDQLKQLADIENETGSDHRFTTAELATYVSQSWCELYNEIVLNNNDEFLSSTNYTLVSGTETYALPSDFYLDRGVDLTSSGYSYTLHRWSFEEREVYQFTGAYTYGMPTAYRVIGENLTFKPVPTGTGNTAKLWYYPTPTVLTSGSSINGIAGFEEFLVCDGAAKALAKDNRSDPVILQRRDRAMAVCRAALTGRSHSHPDRITRRQYSTEPLRKPYPR